MRDEPARSWNGFPQVPIGLACNRGSKPVEYPRLRADQKSIHGDDANAQNAKGEIGQ
jgi:hypothetical protein